MAGVGLGSITVAALAFAIVLASRRPRSDREWATDHAVQPSVTIADGLVRVDSVRDFRHGADGTLLEAYRSVSFDLAAVRAVWFALVPFAERWRGLAHTFDGYGYR